MKVSSDRKTLSLDVRGPLTATQVDEFIRQLGVARAEMTPEVPATREELSGTEMDGVLMETEPSLSVAALRAGGFRIWVRSRGLGWQAFEITNHAAASVRDLITRYLGPIDAVNLVAHSEPRRH